MVRLVLHLFWGKLTSEIKNLKNEVINVKDEIMKMKAVKNRELGKQVEDRMKNASMPDKNRKKSQERKSLAAVNSKLNQLTHSSLMKFQPLSMGRVHFRFKGCWVVVFILFKFNRTFCM